MVLRARRVARDEGRARLHPHARRHNGAARHLRQERDAGDAGAVRRLQLEGRREEDVAVVRDVGAGRGGEADSEAVERRVQRTGDGEVPAVVAHRRVPRGGGGGADVEADAVVDDAPELDGAVLEAALLAQGAHADGEALDLADLDHAGVEVAQDEADVGLALPVRDRRAQHAQALVELGRVAVRAAVADGQRRLAGGAGVEDRAAHGQPRRGARQGERHERAVGALADDEVPARGAGRVHRGLQRRPVVGQPVAERAEVARRQGLGELVLDRARHAALVGRGDHAAARDRRDVAQAVEAQQPVGPRRALGQRGPRGRVGGVEADRAPDLVAQLLQRGDLAVELVVQRLRAQHAVRLEVRGAGERDAAEQGEARARGRRLGEAHPAALGQARALDGEAREHAAPVDPHLDVARGEDGEGVGEAGLQAVGDVLHARRDVADADVLGHGALQEGSGGAVPPFGGAEGWWGRGGGFAPPGQALTRGGCAGRCRRSARRAAAAPASRPG